MRLLLIGGNGFIGRHVTRRLVDAWHDVTVFHRGTASVRAGARSMAGDRNRLGDYADLLRSVGADVVIDFVLGSERQARAVMDVLRGATPRVVALSSCDVYRACGILHRTEAGGLEPVPLTESSPLRSARQTYSPEALARVRDLFPWIDDEYDKIPVERTVLGDERIAGTVLRLPMVYGPGDRLRRFKPLLERMAADPDRVVFERRHAAWRSPRGYVENVAAAIVLAATSPEAAGRVYNVAEREAFSELEWARMIANAIGWRGTFDVVTADDAPAEARMPGRLEQHWDIDSTRIRTELGYVEPIARDDAIARTTAWEQALRS